MKSSTFRTRVGERIRRERQAAALSQEALADLLPGTVGGSQVSRWERGEHFPAYDSIVALARALEVTEERLLCG